MRKPKPQAPGPAGLSMVFDVSQKIGAMPGVCTGGRIFGQTGCKAVLRPRRSAPGSLTSAYVAASGPRLANSSPTRQESSA
jgi:hypothetical protein